VLCDYGGVVATITALVSSSFRNNKNIFIACLFIFIFGLISAISMVLAVRQFAFGVFTKSVTFRSNCSNYDDFKNKIENEMTNSPWKSIIRICSGFSLILFMVGIIIGLIALFI
jgi:hypothetical protein